MIGLYNTYGRLATDARRTLIRGTRGRLSWIDPFVRSRRLASDKERAWIADQYFHPHESKHTMGEVLNWFDEAGLEFVRGIPSVTPGDDALDSGSLLSPMERGGTLAHGMAQLKLAASFGWEGGLFIMIARKPA